jgi:elongator complex protein 3
MAEKPMTPLDHEDWMNKRKFTDEKMKIAREVMERVREGADVMETIRSTPLPQGGHVSKSALVKVYREMVESGEWDADPLLLARIRMKPGRTLSGVTTVTVLTKPHPCPGHCIFCPDDTRMPKSYLPDEPGAARAFQNEFDPYRQVRSRIEAYQAVGHPTDKIELLILGGSWSAYPRSYQEWFVLRCFDAMNDTDSQTLPEAQHINENAPHRNVGLVIETRPDQISRDELVWLRKLGVTKVQMGAQSLDDRILKLNRRGHSSADLQRATALLRAGGFKIVLHWMPNLLGATVDSDREDFARLWQEFGIGAGYCPDEIKIYPTQLLEKTELYQHWESGAYRPYSTDELVGLIADVKPTIPVYCRVNRIIRDIPSTHVVAGNRRTSLRQDAMAELQRRGQRCQCVRCREVRGQKIDPAALARRDTIYQAANAEEHFLQIVTPDDRLAGFLRLSLPAADAQDLQIEDLKGAALIREVHVYGQSLEVGAEVDGAAQHIGLGTSLLTWAGEIARGKGYADLAVIAAIGTRKYYESRGFARGELYMVKPV